MCGPGADWMRDCRAGLDIAPSDAIHVLVILGGGTFGGDLFSPMTMIQRSDAMPLGALGLQTINTEIVSMVATGGGLTMSVGSVFTLPRSVGQITERPDMLLADSFFDVFFRIEGAPLGAIGPLHNNTPVHMTAVIDHVPPLVNPGTCRDNPSGLNCYSGNNLPVPLFDAAGVQRATLTVAIHELKTPEPATALLSGAVLFGLGLLRRTSLRRRQ